MSACCSGGCASNKPPVDPKYRRILWVALALNAGMFFIEIVGGLTSGSSSLLADAVDFFGDAFNYLISIAILGLSLTIRARAALVKGVTMGAYGLFVLGAAAWHFTAGTVPEASTMGVIGVLALAVNVFVAVLLFAYRTGDSNMRSVWLCSRNDAIGNLAIILAALGVFGTDSGWPDIIVAAVMGVLGLTAARSVISHALHEMKADAAPSASQKTVAVELKRR